MWASDHDLAALAAGEPYNPVPTLAQRAALLAGHDVLTGRIKEAGREAAKAAHLKRLTDAE